MSKWNNQEAKSGVAKSTEDRADKARRGKGLRVEEAQATIADWEGGKHPSMGWQGPSCSKVLQELLQSGLEGRNESRGRTRWVQNSGGKTAVGELVGGSLGLQAGKKKMEFEVGIMKHLMDRAKGLKKGVHKILKVVEHEGRVTDRSAENCETKKVEGAAAISAGGMMQVMGQGGQEVRERECAGSREEDAAFLLVEVKAQWGTMLVKEVQDESDVDKANNAIAVVHESG